MNKMSKNYVPKRPSSASSTFRQRRKNDGDDDHRSCYRNGELEPRMKSRALYERRSSPRCPPEAELLARPNTAMGRIHVDHIDSSYKNNNDNDEHESNSNGSNNNRFDKKKMFIQWCEGFEKDLESFRSTALLCKLKMMQAKLMTGGLRTKPDRLKVAMCCMCIEKACEALPNDQREVFELLFDELCASIFPDFNPDSENPFVGMDILLNPASIGPTYFEIVQDLRKRIEILNKRIEILKETNAMKEEEQEDAKRKEMNREKDIKIEDKGQIEEATLIDDKKEKFVSLFSKFDEASQEMLLQELLMHQKGSPSVKLGAMIGGLMQDQDRKQLIFVLSNLKKL